MGVICRPRRASAIAHGSNIFLTSALVRVLTGAKKTEIEAFLPSSGERPSGYDECAQRRARRQAQGSSFNVKHQIVNITRSPTRVLVNPLYI